MRRRFRRIALASTAVAVVAIAGGVTYAVADIGGGGIINGCYKSVNGQLRLIDPAMDSCNPSETSISWGQTGTQGPKGDKGDKGDPGPQGPPGLAATSLFASVSTECTPIVVGSGAISVERAAPGRCDVRFNQNVSGCLASATTRAVSSTGQEEARFILATTISDQENITYIGLGADEVAIVALDTTGGIVVPPVPFKVFVFCPQAGSASFRAAPRKQAARPGARGLKSQRLTRSRSS